MPYADPEKRKAYHAAYSKAWAAENRERINAAQRRFHSAHRDEERVANALYHRENAAVISIRKRRTLLEKKYDLTPEQFGEMNAAQGGVCLICRRPETMLGSGGLIRPLSVDHDHATGEIRGLLCAHCNAGLGHFEDDPELLAAARLYLIERTVTTAAEVA